MGPTHGVPTSPHTSGRAINLEASLGAADNSDTDFVYDLLADYYPTPELSFGARYQGFGSDDQYGIGARF